MRREPPRIARPSWPWALAALAIAGCSHAARLGGASIALSPGALAFVATAGGGDPAAQVVTIGNSGGGTLVAPTATVSYADGSGWLSTSVTGESAPFTLTVQPSIAGMSAGTYRATVFVASEGTGNTPQRVEVALTLGPVPPPSTGPTLVQNVSSSTNPLGIGIEGNNFKFTLPNPVLSGNALVLKVAYLASASFSAAPVTDDVGNVWPTSPSASRADASGNIRLAVFVLPNAAPGLTTITIHFTAAINPVQYDCGEWYNIATSAPVNGSAAVSNLSTPTISPGELTPGANADGNLILYYIHTDSSPDAGNVATNIAAAPPFTLLDADIAWAGQANSYHASSYYWQRTPAPVNPSMTVAMGAGTDRYVALAIALRVARAGTPPAARGIRIVKVHHFTHQEGLSGTWSVQFPTTGGNLLVLNHGSFTGISDNRGNTYARATTVGHPNMWVSYDAATGPDLKLSLTPNQGTSGILRAYEIVGGATSGQPETVAQMDTVDCSGMASISSAPSITPGSANGLTIALMTLGQGPGLSATSPPNAVFGLVTYTGETDLDTMENADAEGHLYNATTAAQNWSWAITAIPGNQCSAGAVHLRAE